MKTRVLLLLTLLLAPAAHGAEGSGEARRLTESLVDYTERGAWPAADRTFRELEAIDDATLTSDDLFMGAQAARSIGDMMACRKRLLTAFDRALMQEETLDERARAWLAELQTNYGHVTIKSKGIGELEVEDKPFQPDRRAAIAHAGKLLKETGVYDGLLPVGEYTWGKSSFTVEAGTEPVKVKVKGPKK